MILVTGFGPYREDLNASGALVNSLKNDLPDALRPLKEVLAFEVITCNDASRETEHLSLEAQLAELLQRCRPALCIHTGQAPSCNRIIVERIATNSFMRAIIDPARPVAYWSNLPGTEGLVAALESHHIPATDSFYAGQHLCNHILYSSRYLAEKSALRHQSGFIHVPVLPEQAIRPHCDAASMPLDMTRKALTLIINQVVAAHRKPVRIRGKSPG
jgi:pyroglutamyl-peptidase